MTPSFKEQKRAAEERHRKSLRFLRGSTRTAPNPVHVTTSLIRQRVEIKTAVGEEVCVVIRVDRTAGVLVLAEPGSYDPRGFWTHRGRVWARRREEIERVTVLEGPITPAMFADIAAKSSLGLVGLLP